MGVVHLEKELGLIMVIFIDREAGNVRPSVCLSFRLSVRRSPLPV